MLSRGRMKEDENYSVRYPRKLPMSTASALRAIRQSLGTLAAPQAFRCSRHVLQGDKKQAPSTTSEITKSRPCPNLRQPSSSLALGPAPHVPRT